MATGPTSEIPEDEKQNITQCFMKYGVDGIKTLMEKRMKEWKTIPLNIAVTGNSGAGKSSYINAIRGLTADDDGAAAVGVTETTISPTPYPHPRNKNCIFWDLPGVGTSNFKRETYLQQVDFQKHDFFIILCSKRFTENDLWLVGTVREQNKKFYCVRTGIDTDLFNAKRSHPNTFNRKITLAAIRNDLVKQMGSNTDVFLIDSFSTLEFDFASLSDRLLNDVPSLKKESMILSFSNLTDVAIEQKRDIILRRIRTISTVVRVVLQPLASAFGFDFINDTIRSEASQFLEQFGLTDIKLMECADSLNLSVEQLRHKWNLRTYPSKFYETSYYASRLFTITYTVYENLNNFQDVLDNMVEDAKKIIHEKAKLLIN